jgi:RNA polymerase sigma-70 factor, ECF subfamily
MQSKNAVPFEAVMNDFYVEIFHYIRKMTQNTEDAKDLTQDVFLKIYEKLHTYRPDQASLRTWIYRIAHNVVINHFRSVDYVRKVRLPEASFEAISAEEDILASVLQAENISSILSLMRQCLNPIQERILHLYFFSELSAAAIAAVLNIKSKTVSNNITLAIAILKRRLEERK